MYLPDSNVVIRSFKGHDPDATFLKRSIEKRSIIISVIVVAEFLVKATDQQQASFNEFLKEFKSLAVDEEAARIAGEYRKQLMRKTNKVFLLDCFLAAQAKAHGLTLVTNNKADFPMEDIRVITP